MTRVLILIGLLFTINFTFSQKQGQALIDSLEFELTKNSADTTIYNIYKKIAATYSNLDQTKHKEYAEKGLVFSEKKHMKFGIANFNYEIGLSLSNAGEDSLALIYLKKCLTLNQELEQDKDVLKRKKAISLSIKCLIVIGNSYKHQSNFPEAQKKYFRALEIAKKSENQTDIASCYTCIVTIFGENQNYKEALKYAQLALKAAQNGGSRLQIAKSYQFLGRICTETNDTKNAITYYQNALKLYKELDFSYGIANISGELGWLYGSEPDLALPYYLEAKNAYQNYSPNHPSACDNLMNLGNLYLFVLAHPNQNYQLFSKNRTALLSQASSYLKQSIVMAKKNNSIDKYANAMLSMSTVNELKGDYKNAYLNFKDSYSINDSIFSQENKNKIAEIDGNYQLSLKDKEIQLNKVTIASQKKQQLFFILGLILISAIG